MADTPNDRAVSELVSVLTLVVFALIIVVAVGANVLLFQSDSGQSDAAFEFQYIGETSSLLITHSSGDTIPAGDLLIRGPERQVRWSEINNEMNNSSPVGPGEAIQIGRENAYGDRVSNGDRIEVVYVSNQTDATPVLSRWNGTA